MSKKILGFILAITLLFTTLPFSAAVSADAYLDAADRYFVEFVQSDTDYTGALEYSHTPLYDENLTAHGREYTFTVGNISGYALMIEIQGENQTFYEIEELFYGKQSPFYGADGLPVYINHNLYLEYKDQGFFDVASGVQVSQNFVEEQAAIGFSYSGTGNFVDHVVTVNYATKNTENYTIQYNLPDYAGKVGESSCASTAGTIILAYYDRFFENLIPDCQVYYNFGSAIVYKSSTVQTIELTATLHDLMLIGTEHDGRTFTEYQQGMNAYVTSRGLTYSTTSTFTNGSFDFNKYKTAVESGKPVAIFCSTYAILNGVIENDGYDTVDSAISSVAHVMAGCGYRVDTYFDESGNQIDQRIYLKISSGLATYGIGYLNINGISTMNHAIATTIS